MMGRQKMGYCIVLAVSLSACNLVGVDNAAPKNMLEICKYWVNPDDTGLQLGTVIMHFSENPMVNPLPATKYTKKNDHIFFIPAADISNDQLRAIMDLAKNNNNKWYSLSISREEKPIPGIKVVFNYDPAIVSMDYHLFNTLGTEKGVVFRLHNQAMVEALKKKQRSLLRVAMLKPFTVIA